MTDTEWAGAGTLRGTLEESGREIGGFAQYRGEIFGFHAALGVNNTSLDYQVTESTGGGTVTTPGKFETGLATDLLGMVVLKGENINGIGMFGLSSLALKGSGGITGDTTASGIKFAAGIEVPMQNQWNFQVTYEYADLGEVEINNSTDKFEVTHSGFFLRMGYRF